MSGISPGDPRFRIAVRRGLVVLTAINLFNYIDRYVVAAQELELSADQALARDSAVRLLCPQLDDILAKPIANLADSLHLGLDPRLDLLFGKRQLEARADLRCD